MLNTPSQREGFFRADYFTVDEAKASAVTRKFWSLFDGPDKNGDGAITKAKFQESAIRSVKNAKSAPPKLGN